MDSIINYLIANVYLVTTRCSDHRVMTDLTLAEKGNIFLSGLL